MAGDRGKWMGEPDITKNVARSIVNQLCTLYDRQPRLSHPQAGARETVEALLDGAGTWQLAAENQRLTVACRESLIRLDVVTDPDPEPGDDPRRLLLRLVPRDHVTATAELDEPDEPVSVREWRLRRNLRGEPAWTIEDWSRTDDGYRCRVLSADGREDLSEHYSEVTDTVYPVLPYVLYHAQRTGHLWNSYVGAELFEGALRVGVMLTDWMHLVLDASWPQRVALNAAVPGASANRGDPSEPVSIPMDRAAVLMLSDARPNQSASIATWEAAGDPATLLGSIQSYAGDLASDFDVSPADLQRSHTDARSGYAIFVTREGQRSAQRRFEPQFRRGDLDLVAKVAAMWGGLPTRGWSIDYPGLPLSIEERQVQAAEYVTRAEQGIASPVQLLAKLDQIPEDEARARLEAIALDRARFAPRSQT
jgi:hypothetical protein